MASHYISGCLLFGHFLHLLVRCPKNSSSCTDRSISLFRTNHYCDRCLISPTRGHITGNFDWWNYNPYWRLACKSSQSISTNCRRDCLELVYIEPLVAVVVAAIVLGEPITCASLLGGTVIWIGVWLVNREERKRT